MTVRRPASGISQQGNDTPPLVLGYQGIPLPWAKYLAT